VLVQPSLAAQLRARVPYPAAMAVLLQTSQGDMVIDLHTDLAPNACKNFIKLCKCVVSRYLGVCESCWR
jgi:Cyclophilin type peptidyl-prolyl cis-trans isomerase/CLD